AQRSTLPALRRLHGRIARDEAAHAELAWDVLAWAFEAGGDDVRHAVHAVRHGVSAHATPQVDRPSVSSLGLLSMADEQAVAEWAHRRAHQRLAPLMA